MRMILALLAGGGFIVVPLAWMGAFAHDKLTGYENAGQDD